MLQSTVRRLLNSLGYELSRLDTAFTDQQLNIIRRVREFTMTGPERLAGLIDAVEYIHTNSIEGDIVECGVWRGGSMMAAALTLLKCGDTSRVLHLFDTFEGMTPPTEKDKALGGESAESILAKTKKQEGPGIWAIASFEDVRQNILSTGYPTDHVRMVRGKVEETLLANAPQKIALLRLDTDWYESTKIELEHLYPRLSSNGILIIDDYGHWQGAREAVDEYFSSQKFKPFLSRLDYTGRLIIKSMPAK